MTLEKLVKNHSLGQNLKSRQVFVNRDSGILLTFNSKLKLQNLLVAT